MSADLPGRAQPSEGWSASDRKQTARRLQLALSAAQLGDWEWEAASDRVVWSERSAVIFGLSPTTAVTWTELRALLHPDDRDRARIAVEEALRDRTDYSVEYRVQRADGVEVWVSSWGSGVYAEDGSALGMIGLVQDITERRRAEESRYRLAAIVESSDDAIVSKSLDGTITSWNHGAELVFGYRAEEIIGRSVLMLIPKERHDEERAIIQTLLRGERIEHFETLRVRKDGTLFPVSLTVSPVFDDAGRIIGASKIARDVTARRDAEEKLREESMVLNLLNETGKVIAGDLDPEMIVQRVTDAATILSGAAFGAFFYKLDEERDSAQPPYAVSAAPQEALALFGPAYASALFTPALLGRSAIRCDDATQDPRFQHLVAQSDASSARALWRSFLAVPVVSRSGELLGGLVFGHAERGIFKQRSEELVEGVAAQAAIAIDNARLYERVRRAAEERNILLEAERAARAKAEHVSVMKDEFLATLSHELRTPLNAILGWAQVLHAQPGLRLDIADGLSIITRNARVQSRLIDDLLDMSRIISGKIGLDVRRVEPHEVVQAAIEAVRHSAEAKQLKLEVALDPHAGAVLGDPNRLQQCVWNLLTNAIKFTPKDGRVRVTLARVDGRIAITVSDSGQGIAPELLPHVFERFRQGDSSTTRMHGGLGLGLSIVKSLAELHGGSVRASSGGRNQGAEFRLELPLMSKDASAASARVLVLGGAAGAGDHPSLSGLKLVVVDDEPDARFLLKRILEDLGAEVYLAESGKEGLELVRRERPNMLISDIAMPEEDGYQFIRKVRQLTPEEGNRTPAVALSAFARAEDRMRALRAGFQAHLAKPVDPDELGALVASFAASA